MFPAPSAAWTAFRAAVLADEKLLADLFATPDAPAFIDACVRRAAALGIPLAATDVAAAITAARHERITRFAA